MVGVTVFGPNILQQHEQVRSKLWTTNGNFFGVRIKRNLIRVEFFASSPILNRLFRMGSALITPKLPPPKMQLQNQRTTNQPILPVNLHHNLLHLQLQTRPICGQCIYGFYVHFLVTVGQIGGVTIGHTRKTIFLMIHMQTRTKITLSLLTIGFILLFISWQTAYYVGTPWFHERAAEPWHMNNYFVVPGLVAYIGFAFFPWLLGGFCFGLITTYLLTLKRVTQKRATLLITLIALATGFTALGFNTFDFMLGCFYWTNHMAPPPIPVDLGFVLFSMDAWNFYFFCFLLPLWLSGFCLGAATTLLQRISEHKR